MREGTDCDKDMDEEGLDLLIDGILSRQRALHSVEMMVSRWHMRLLF